MRLSAKAISTTEVSRGLELNPHPSLQPNGLILLRKLVSLKILALSSLNTLELLFINFHLHSIRLSSKIHGAHKTFIMRQWNQKERNRELGSWTQYVNGIVTKVPAFTSMDSVYFGSILFRFWPSFM